MYRNVVWFRVYCFPLSWFRIELLDRRWTHVDLSALPARGPTNYLPDKRACEIHFLLFSHRLSTVGTSLAFRLLVEEGEEEEEEDEDEDDAAVGRRTRARMA